MTRLLACGWIFVSALTLWHQILPYTDDVSVSFPGYWLVAREVLSGTPTVRLYDDVYLAQKLAEHGFPGDQMFGPPTLALTLAPLAWLPHTVARTVWLCGVLWPLLMGSLVWLLAPLGWSGLALGAAFALSTPVTANMAVGQVYPIMLALHCVALHGWCTGRPWHSAAGLAPMVAMRGWYGLLPAAGWLVSGRPRGTIAAAAATVAIVVATLPVLGLAAWRHFLTVQLPSAGGDSAMVLAYQTWRSLALRLGTFHPIISPDPPIPGAGTALWLGGAILIGAATLWAARAGGRRPIVFALWVTTSLLLAPVAEDHHMLLVALPAALLWRHGVGARGIVLAAGLLLWPAWPYDQPALLGGWRSILGYPRLGAVILLWVGCLWICRRR